jgi:hypothetical protein
MLKCTTNPANLNKFFLASGIFSILFVIYMWFFYLPFYENTDIYSGVKTVVTVISVALLFNAVLTTYLAIKPSSREEGT